jgi:hypothetical protein
VNQFWVVKPNLLVPGPNDAVDVNPKKKDGTDYDTVKVTITVIDFPSECGTETLTWSTVPKIVFGNDGDPPVDLSSYIISSLGACPATSLEVTKVSGTGSATSVTISGVSIATSGSVFDGRYKFKATTISGQFAEKEVDVRLCGDEVISL